MVTEREQLDLPPIGDDPEVGRWLAAMEEARGRTLRELKHVPDDLVTREVLPALGTIGDLTYHIALIEADWLLDDILGLPSDDWPAWLAGEFPIDVRDDVGRLSRVPSEPLSRHLLRLERVRALTIESLRHMTASDFARLRSRARYDVAPSWTIHHLLQHEAEHRAHIALIRDLSTAE